MKTTIVKYAGIVLILTVVLSSCRKDMDIKPDMAAEKVESMHDMKVADDFDWKTFHDVEIDFTSASTASLIIRSATGAVYHKAMLQAGERYLTHIALPSYEKEVTVVLNGQPVTMQIAGERLVQTH